MGDFGLIYFDDEDNTRISETFGNVGSRDWMPPWAQTIRLEDVKASFDVFSLGKVLWSMISNVPKLQLWYFTKDENNLEKIFPKIPYIKYANKIFEKCIVEKEKDCLNNASDLLTLIDEILYLIGNNVDFFCDEENRPCKFCGKGTYTLLNDDFDKIKNKYSSNQFTISQSMTNEFMSDFGINTNNLKNFKIFYCNYCGNTQWFFLPSSFRAKAWKK